MFEIRGEYVVKCWDHDGSLAWEERFENGICTQGINNMLAGYFAAGPLVGPSIGLVDANNFTGLAASDTLAAHPGWVAISAIGLPGTATWAAPVNGVIVTSTGMIYTNGTANAINALGAYLQAGGGLLSTGLFTNKQTIQPAQKIEVTYICTITPTN